MVIHNSWRFISPKFSFLTFRRETWKVFIFPVSHCGKYSLSTVRYCMDILQFSLSTYHTIEISEYLRKIVEKSKPIPGVKLWACGLSINKKRDQKSHATVPLNVRFPYISTNLLYGYGKRTMKKILKYSQVTFIFCV